MQPVVQSAIEVQRTAQVRCSELDLCLHQRISW
jgi:hypothetical protein